MFLGLFQNSMQEAVSSVASQFTKQDADKFISAIKPAQHGYSVASFFLTSAFVVYFALFKGSSKKLNYCMLFARALTLIVYVPLLCWFEAYVDAAVVFLTITARFLYTGYWSFRYKTHAFIVLNTDKLAFVCGKYWYYEDQPYIVMVGGEQYVQFGYHMVPFVVANDLYVALRGIKDDDVPLVRRVELINGTFIYIFAQEPAVGVVNMRFSSPQLHEDSV